MIKNTYNFSNGNLKSTLYGNGPIIYYNYDEYDRVTQIANQNKVLVKYIYNKKGLIARCIDEKSGETTDYEYDCNGNLVYKYLQTNVNGTGGAYRSYYNNKGEYVKINNVFGTYQTVAYGTDADGNGYVNNNGLKITTETDDFERITLVNETINGGSANFKTSISYVTNSDNDNKYSTKLISDYKQTYDKNIYFDLSYKYDANGNITEVYDNKCEDTVYVYRYNALNQVTSVNDYYYNTYTTYSYDSSGNITKKVESDLHPNFGYPIGQSRIYNYSYDTTWCDKMISYNNQTITYDKIGNPLNYRDGMTMQWTNGRELASITKNGKTVKFTYNADGLRTQKNIDGDITYYYYDEENRLVGAQSGIFTYVFYYDTDGNIMSMEQNGSRYFFVKNMHGDVIAITNNVGTIQVQYTYDAWGNTLSVTDKNGNDISNSTLAKIVPFRYRGYIYDTETGLYYLQSRYYDPTTGRFINADVYTDTNTGSPLSTNMFAYCENNPVMNIDFDGYWAKSSHASITKSAGFSGMTQTWVQYPDIYFKSGADKINGKTYNLSAPFHNSGKACKIAQYLYNKALQVKKYGKHVTFFYGKGNKIGKLDPDYLGYKDKDNKIKGVIVSNDNAKDLLKLLNKNSKNINRPASSQANALVGLALHILQDYYAHRTEIRYSKSKKGLRNGKGTETTTTKFSHFVIDSTTAFEDNQKVFRWRYDNSKLTTNQLYKFYKKRKSISNIKPEEYGMKDKIYKYKMYNSFKNKKITYYFATTKYKLKIYS